MIQTFQILLPVPVPRLKVKVVGVVLDPVSTYTERK